MKNVKPSTRQSFFHLAVLTFFIFLFIVLLCGKNHYFAAITDWYSQHSVIPDYFRMQFYKTGDLLPQFNMHLGAGENAFNFAYYGYLNPVILLSYLMPHVPMYLYMIISSIALYLAAVYLMYFWLRSNHTPANIAFCVTFLFAFSGPMLYQFHKQIMFVNYMPFLIMALIGIDRYFATRKRGFFIWSMFLALQVSYFFCFSLAIVTTTYGIYKYLCIVKKPSWKSFLDWGTGFALSMINSVLLCCLLYVPAFMALLNGRGENPAGTGNVTLSKLMIPNFHVDFILYGSYGLGLTFLSIVAVVCGFFVHKKSYFFLCSSIAVCTCLPFLIYFLNGALYIRGKALIPFLPLVLLMVAFFLKDFQVLHFSKRFYSILGVVIIFFSLFSSVTKVVIIDVLLTGVLLYAGKRLKTRKWIIYPLLAVSFIICYFINHSEALVEKASVKNVYSADKYSLIQSALDKDDSFYRSNDYTTVRVTENIIYHNRYYQTGFYSSVYNIDYVNFCHRMLNQPMSTNNDFSINNCNDIFFAQLMGVKYILTKEDAGAPVGYSLLDQSGAFRLYQNNNVYSLGFTAKETMSQREFLSLNSCDRNYAVLKYIVTEEDKENVYTSPFEPISYNTTLLSDYFPKEDDFYHIKLDKDKTITLPLPEQKKDIYMIQLKIRERTKKRINVTINGICNSLSNKSAPFPNENFVFSYPVSRSEEMKNITITFSAGDYYISDIDIQGCDYADLQAAGKEHTQMKDVEIKGDNEITGTISCDEDRTFIMTIPYDKHFTLYVDGKETSYEKMDTAFIGTKLSAGTHKIRLVYKSPGLKLGALLCIAGLILFIFQMWIQRNSSS